MAVVRQLQTNFSGGELTPRMAARVDTGAYQNGAGKLRNARTLIQGGVKRRPGLRYVDTLGSPETVKTAEFAFNDDQSYLFIFRPGKLDIYFRDLSFATNLTGMAWDTADKVRNLRVAQNGDTLICCHQDMPTQQVVRTGATSFTADVFEFEKDSDSRKVFQPFTKYADPRTTLKADKPEGDDATLTASEAVFETAHEGQFVRHKGRQILVKTVTSGTEAIGDILDPLRRSEDTGVNLIANESFDSAEFWRLGPNWEIRGAKAQPKSNLGSELKQDVPGLDTSSSYTLEFELSNVNNGEITEVRLDSQVIGGPFSTNQTHSVSFTPDTDAGFLVFFASADFDGELDNVSLKKGGSGQEMIEDGGMDDDQFWIKGGTWQITDGVARTEQKTSFDLAQQIQPQLEKDYILTFDVSDSSAGTLTIRFDDQDIGTVSGGDNATKTFEFRAKAADGDLTFGADTDWDGAIDNVSVRMKPDNGETTDWEEQAFSSLHGYARVPFFHSQRLILAASRDRPNQLWMSKPARFFNFETGEAEDDDAISHTIAESRIAEIRAITSLRHLQIFTSEMELYIPTGQAQPLTPTNVRFLKQTPLGVSMVEPREFDGAVLFMPKSKATLREFIFSEIQQAYSSDVVSLLSQHLLNDPQDMDVTLESEGQPEQYAYLVNNDGTMAVFLSNRAEEITAWQQWDTQGQFKAVSAVADRVFVVTERDIDGNGLKQYVEVFDENLTLDLADTDSQNGETTDWSMAHLANSTVQATSGNFYMGEFEADSSGAITLTQATDSIQMGLNYQFEVETLPPELQVNGEGASVGEKRRIIKVSAVLDETLNLRISRIQRSATLNIRQVNDDLSLEPPKITGRQDFRLLGWDDEGIVNITQTVPLPVTLLGLNVEMEI